MRRPAARPSTLWFALGALLVTLGWGAACSPSSGYVAPTCHDESDCPTGLVCHLLACVEPGSFDAGPDASVADASVDGGTPDASADDAGETDAGDLDGGDDAGLNDDAGVPDDGGVVDTDAGTTDGGAPTTLAPAGAATSAGPVNGIECEPLEQLAFHIHAHVQVYVDGEMKLIPPFIGFGSHDGNGCISWLHTHDYSGIVHIESPYERLYTLGDFFAVWGIPLTPPSSPGASDAQVGPATGQVTAYLNGQPWTGNIKHIPLDAYNLVQIDVGTVVPPQPYTFPAGY